MPIKPHTKLCTEFTTNIGENIVVTPMQNKCVACGQQIIRLILYIDTQPIYDIENAFNIKIDEDEAMEIYDMTLDEAIKKIMEMKSVQK
jgi:hypothetical protein